MQIFTKQEAQQNKQAIIDFIKEGKIFVYPTDTVYGLGCDATNDDAVKKIRDMKQSYDQPFSIIAPSKQWILDNGKVNETIQAWLNKLPGPYTLILNLKAESPSPEVTLDTPTIGMRIPDNWFTEIIAEANTPFVTTSANIHGQPFLTDPKNLSENMKEKVDIVIDEGMKVGKPSTIVNLTGEKPVIKER